jgi:recombination protein RecT
MARIHEMKAQQAAPSQPAPEKKQVPAIFSYLTDNKKVAAALAAVASKHLQTDRCLRLAVQAVKDTPRLMECDPLSVLGAFMTSAALGLQPNTIFKHAFLIPFQKWSKDDQDRWVSHYECQFLIGAQGYRVLAHRSPYIANMQSEAIHKGDIFKHQMGSESFLRYEKSLEARAELIGSFCFTKLTSGEEMATVLTKDEILKLRANSEAYSSLVKKLDELGPNAPARDRQKAAEALAGTPWVKWEDTMAANSATKRHARQLPLEPDDQFTTATVLDGAGDLRTMTDPDMVREVMTTGAATLAGAEEEGEDPSPQFPAVQNDPSPTLAGMPVSQVQAGQQAAAAPASGSKKGQLSMLGDLADEEEPQEVAISRTALMEAMTVEALDDAMDKARSVATPSALEEFNQLYRDRRESLAAAQSTRPSVQPAKPGLTSVRAARLQQTQMMEME